MLSTLDNLLFRDLISSCNADICTSTVELVILLALLGLCVDGRLLAARRNLASLIVMPVSTDSLIASLIERYLGHVLLLLSCWLLLQLMQQEVQLEVPCSCSPHILHMARLLLQADFGWPNRQQFVHLIGFG